MKYIDAEKLIAEIESLTSQKEKQLKSFNAEDYTCSVASSIDCKLYGNMEVLSIIKSLQQKQPIKVYRVENEKEQKGLWRKFDGTWEPLFDMLTDGQCKDMPMDDDPIYREGGKQWFASAPSKETLQKWFSKRDLEELTAKGFTISEFEVLGHKKISEFEYIFTRDNIINRTYLKVSDIYPQEQLIRESHKKSWIEGVKKELQHEEELLDMRLDTLRRIREKKNQFQQEQPDNIVVPLWCIKNIENTLRIQNNINLEKKVAETCQDRNIRGSLNQIRKLLNGEELSGLERSEPLMEQPKVSSGEDVMTMCNQILIDWVKEGKTQEEKEQREQAHIRFFELYDDYLMQEQPEVDLEKIIGQTYHDGSVTDTSNIDHVGYENIARYFYELGLKARKSIWHNVSEEVPTKNGLEVIVACRNKNKEDGIWLYDLIQCWEGKWEPRENWETPVKWAYIRDLDDARKEE